MCTLYVHTVHRDVHIDSCADKRTYVQYMEFVCIHRFVCVHTLQKHSYCVRIYSSTLIRNDSVSFVYKLCACVHTYVGMYFLVYSIICTFIRMY